MSKRLINTDAADGGLWHQDELCRRLSRWRSDPVGATLACALFGAQALSRAKAAGAERMEDTAAKPDLIAWALLSDGTRLESRVSAKLISGEMTASVSRASHHAARVRFEEAHDHGLLPALDFALKGALLEHFIDGEALSRREPEVIQNALDHFQKNWPTIARCAVRGLAEPFAHALVISVANGKASEGGLSLTETRCWPIERAIEFLLNEPPGLSSPREGQVGVIGSRLMHLQRGQALSLGAQRDIQIKINAQALFNAMPPLRLG